MRLNANTPDCTQTKILNVLYSVIHAPFVQISKPKEIEQVVQEGER